MTTKSDDIRLAKRTLRRMERARLRGTLTTTEGLNRRQRRAGFVAPTDNVTKDGQPIFKAEWKK